jgi:hypothetical protein
MTIFVTRLVDRPTVAQRVGRPSRGYRSEQQLVDRRST